VNNITMKMINPRAPMPRSTLLRQANPPYTTNPVMPANKMSQPSSVPNRLRP
jgi:hypothetical protein